jgi:hypothetical protein
MKSRSQITTVNSEADRSQSARIMKSWSCFLLLSVFAVLSPFAKALVPAADPATVEGWRAHGFPVDDFLPWSLQIESKAITALNGCYIVVSGYLVATSNSIVLFANEEAAKKGRMGDALVLSMEDSAALRWLFSRRRSEGFYAVGGIFERSKGGSVFGHLSNVRFAMKVEEEPKPEGSASAAARSGTRVEQARE